MKTLVRSVGWLNRFVVAIETLGILNTLKIFLIARFRKSNSRIILPNGQLFVFRGKLDMGVVSHFYKEGYLIKDTSKYRIQTIIDAGANIGDETARFLFHYPDAKIVAIEPDESNFSMLHKNFESTTDQVRLIKGGLWPVRTHLRVVAGTSKESFHVVETPDFDDSVKSWTIPDIMNSMNWERIDILKLDIEGAEYELFTRNYEEWIPKVNAFIFEVPDNDRPGSTQMIYKAVSSQNYNSYVCGENLILIRAELPWELIKVVGFNG